MSKRKVPEINKKIFPYDLVIAYWEDIVGSCEWSDITEGATHYHADFVYPYWADSLNRTTTIDNHIFYK